MHVSPAATPLPDDRMDVAVVSEIPGLEVLRVDAVPRIWTWYHETYTVAIAFAPMQVEWRYRGRLHRSIPGCIGFFEPAELHTDLRKLHPRDVLRVVILSPAFGLPPHAYQMHVRLSRAMTLIRRGLPLVQVALEAGFHDQSHLMRHFTRAVGISPGRYRQEVH